MRVYTYSEARQQLASLLKSASRDGSVEIRRRDGERFVVLPKHDTGSPLDVPAVKTKKPITRRDVVEMVRDSRRRG
jgi:prevent-host-death family protein